MKGTVNKVVICGKEIQLGDYVKVEYTTGIQFKGGTIKGKITELWDNTVGGNLQGRVENGWCFHDNDIIIEHIPKDSNETTK